MRQVVQKRIEMQISMKACLGKLIALTFRNEVPIDAHSGQYPLEVLLSTFRLHFDA